MDILTDYLGKKERKKLVVSTFFKKERENVEAYCNNLQTNDISFDLKKYWANEIEKFAEANKGVQIIKDYYLIDFNDLQIIRKSHLIKNEIKQDILNARVAIVNTTKVSTESEEKLAIPLASVVTFLKLEKERKKLKHKEEYHKKDLLYYQIVDLTTSNSSSASHSVFTKKDRKRYMSDYSSYINVNVNISNAAKFILKDLKKKTLKTILKESKKSIRASNDINKKIKKKMVKICKVYRNMLEDDNCNKFSSYLNEVEYTHQFIYRILKEVLYDCDIVFRLGESHLQCAAKNTNDDERTQAGPKIDIIILHKLFKFAISICEVSGPNYKTNKNHFLGDRNKLGKNMRSILNYIHESTTTPNESAFKKIKLYGVQVYLDQLYLYSLTPIGYDYSVFVLENTLKIPVTLSLLSNQLPAFLGWIWNLNHLFKQMITSINSFIEMSKDEEILQVDSQSSSATSQESTSHKKQNIH